MHYLNISDTYVRFKKEPLFDKKPNKNKAEQIRNTIKEVNTKQVVKNKIE